MDFRSVAQNLGRILSEEVPKEWDGRKSILRMKESRFPHWRQMEWIGFYFQFLCQGCLSSDMTIPGPKYGRVEFDGFCEFPWDFKAHAINTTIHQIIVNDRVAVEAAIREYGQVGVILAVGKVEYNDDRRTFQKWHSALKGGRSKYEAERVKRGAWSRLRKVFFGLQQISFIRLDKAALGRCGSFQTNFRNADGSPRRTKVLVNLERLNEGQVHFIEFR